jgi:hypothetical protein
LDAVEIFLRKLRRTGMGRTEAADETPEKVNFRCLFLVLFSISISAFVALYWATKGPAYDFECNIWKYLIPAPSSLLGIMAIFFMARSKLEASVVSTMGAGAVFVWFDIFHSLDVEISHIAMGLVLFSIILSFILWLLYERKKEAMEIIPRKDC